VVRIHPELSVPLRRAVSRPGRDLRPAIAWTFFGSGLNTKRDARLFATEIADVLNERGLLSEQIGVDRLETVGYLALAEAGVRIADAQPAIEQARAVKTLDELAVLRANARVCDAAVAQLRASSRPGVTENELWGTFIGAALKSGAEWCETLLLSSGPRTNPWMQEATNRVVHDGELVAFDMDLVGERGYLTDTSRTYLCGDRPPTDEQRRLYQIAYAYVHDNLPEFGPAPHSGSSVASSGRGCPMSSTRCAAISGASGMGVALMARGAARRGRRQRAPRARGRHRGKR
jgi:Xaa-Pro dipeptidase